MAATKPELIENRRSELTAAFLAFGSVSEQLSGAFESLRGQVAQLQSELGEARAGKQHLAARLSALLKGLPGGVLVLDSAGAIQEYNPAAVQLLGEPLLGQLFTAVLARAAVNARSLGEHAELRSGRFVNVSRRDLKDGGDVVLRARSPRDGLERQITLRCVTEPDEAQAALLNRLGLVLNRRPAGFDRFQTLFRLFNGLRDAELPVFQSANLTV